MEMTATQISELLNVNRKTVNLWIGKIRQRIFLLVEQERMRNAQCVQMDETYFTKSIEYSPKYLFPYEEIVVFGMINEQGKVYATIVDKPSKKEVFPIIKECCAKGATIYTDGATLYK